MNQVALFLNGALFFGSIYGTGGVNKENSSIIVFIATAGDVLTLREYISSRAIMLGTKCS